MDERVRFFLRETGPVLSVDIGHSLQHAILARPGQDPESWPRYSFASNAQMVAQRILELKLLKCPIWLYGSQMGGGFENASRMHLAAGLPVAATAEAAKSLHDNLDTVTQMGIEIAETCPANHVPVHLCDYNPDFWETFLKLSCLPRPHMVLAAAQDHGEHQQGNRHGRLDIWQKLISATPAPKDWIYRDAPPACTRLAALRKSTGGPVADSATAAILGALCDEEVLARNYRDGVTIINAGTRHVMAALVYREEVYGIYEHHTEKRGMDMLLEDLRQFRLRWLPPEPVQESGGQGACYGRPCENAGGFEPTFILGAKARLLKGAGKLIAPHGDMPHAGCLGLIYGWARANARVGE